MMTKTGEVVEGRTPPEKPGTPAEEHLTKRAAERVERRVAPDKPAAATPPERR